MKVEWIKSSKSTKLLIFFSGWGIDFEPFKHIEVGKCDVLFIHDYSSNLDVDRITNALSNYKKIRVIAYSMGVRMAHIILNQGVSKRNIQAMSINGTFQPIHKEFGIHPSIVTRFIKKFDEKSLLSFYMKMFQSDEQYNQFLLNRPKRSLDSLKEELIYFYNSSLNITLPLSPSLVFSNVLISTDDQVIQPDKQVKYWQSGKDCSINHFNGPHHIFYSINSWDELYDFAI